MAEHTKKSLTILRDLLYKIPVEDPFYEQDSGKAEEQRLKHSKF